MADRIAAADPQIAEWQWYLALSLWRLADLAERRGDPVAALGRWQEAARLAAARAKAGRGGGE